MIDLWAELRELLLNLRYWFNSWPKPPRDYTNERRRNRRLGK